MKTLALLCLLLSTFPDAALAQAEPLGLAMEGYPYPNPVSYFPLKTEGQDLRMAYMDVPPTAGTPRGTVVLFHGKNFFGAYWKGTIAVLAGAGFRVVVPDQ